MQLLLQPLCALQLLVEWQPECAQQVSADSQPRRCCLRLLLPLLLLLPLHRHGGMRQLLQRHSLSLHSHSTQAAYMQLSMSPHTAPPLHLLPTRLLPLCLLLQLLEMLQVYLLLSLPAVSPRLPFPSRAVSRTATLRTPV